MNKDVTGVIHFSTKTLPIHTGKTVNLLAFSSWSAKQSGSTGERFHQKWMEHIFWRIQPHKIQPQQTVETITKLATKGPGIEGKIKQSTKCKTILSASKTSIIHVQWEHLLVVSQLVAVCQVSVVADSKHTHSKSHACRTHQSQTSHWMPDSKNNHNQYRKLNKQCLTKVTAEWLALQTCSETEIASAFYLPVNPAIRWLFNFDTALHVKHRMQEYTVTNNVIIKKRNILHFPLNTRSTAVK